MKTTIRMSAMILITIIIIACAPTQNSKISVPTTIPTTVPTPALTQMSEVKPDLNKYCQTKYNAPSASARTVSTYANGKMGSAWFCATNPNDTASMSPINMTDACSKYANVPYPVMKIDGDVHSYVCSATIPKDMLARSDAAVRTVVPTPSPVPTPVPKQIPVGTPFKGFPNKPCTVVSMRFFEADFYPPPREERIYKSVFDAKTAAFIHWELIMQCTPSSRVDFTIHAIHYGSDGSLIVEYDHQAYIDTNWGGYLGTKGSGPPTPGKWVRDNYTVVLIIDGMEVTRSSFTVQ